MSAAVLSGQQRQQLADHIDQCLLQLEGEISHLKMLIQPVSPDVSIGRLTRLDALNELAVNEKALVSAQNRQRRLRAAVEHADDPGYGCCSHCDEPIPFARLLALPETRLCVVCAEQIGG